MNSKTKTDVAKNTRKKRRLTRRQRNVITFYLFISPWLIGFLAFVLGPMLASLGISFMWYDLFNAENTRWIGFANYQRMFTRDRYFFHTLRVTFMFALLSVPLGLIFSMFIAILLRNITKGVKIFRTIYYLPVVVSGIAVMVLWVYIFNPEIGLLNQALALVGIEGPRWIHSAEGVFGLPGFLSYLDPSWALFSLVLMGLWSVGNTVIIWLAGLAGISKELYEASSIDGANRVQQFFHMTVPALSPTIFFNLVMGIIGALQVFNQAFVMTDGGPQNATLFYNFRLWQTAFTGQFDMGYASALAWILFLIIMALTALVFKSSAMWVHYESGEE